MMQDDWLDRQPGYGAKAFECPYCRVYSAQSWAQVDGWGVTNRALFWKGWKWSECLHCHHVALWSHEEELIYPFRSDLGPDPNPDMPHEVRVIYEEAREVYPVSPRACAALLRLALQTLINTLEPGSKSMNVKIGRLVKRGLDPTVQQAMDVLRVVGNNAVHPGEILHSEDAPLVPALFELLNLVVQHVLSRPKSVTALFDSLPESAKRAVAQRDAPKAIEAGPGGSTNSQALESASC